MKIAFLPEIAFSCDILCCSGRLLLAKKSSAEKTS
jgi:hypothetical protein